MIIGVLGFIGSGKGTVGEYLETKGFIKESFAGLVKDVTSVMFGWPRTLLEGDTAESRKFREEPDLFWSTRLGKPFTPRFALQLMGTEAGRKVFHENFWVLALDNKIRDGRSYVITDVRFPNELDYIKTGASDGILIEVSRGKQPSWYYSAAAANYGSGETKVKEEAFMMKSGIHESEWRWCGAPVDFKLTNDGTLEDLHQQINAVLSIHKY